jgi:hypothetical protein
MAEDRVERMAQRNVGGDDTAMVARDRSRSCARRFHRRGPIAAAALQAPDRAPEVVEPELVG